MVSGFKFFLGFTSYFLITKCSDLQIKEYSKVFDYKDDRLIVDGHNVDPGLLLSQLSSIKFLNELTIREFVFDDVSVKEFSKAISALSIKKLSIIQCDFNEEIATLFIISPSIQSIHLEELNLSSRGIEIILNKLDPSVESITISGCYENKPKKHLQSFSKFSLLKQIDIDKKSIGDLNIYHSLRSFTTTSLESIKLRQFELDPFEINSILEEWIHKFGKAFTNNLKVLEFGIFDYNFRLNGKLIQQILSFPNLKILSCDFNDDHLDFSIDALPPNLEQLILNDAIIDINANQKSIYSRNNLLASKFTHLAVNGMFFEFPTYLLCMKNLEYLNLDCISCDTTPTLESFQSPSSLKHLIIQSKHLSPFMPNFDENFKVIEILEVQSRSFHKDFFYFEKLFTNSTLKSLKLDFRSDDFGKFKFNSKCECLFEELELKNVYWKFICQLLDKFTFFQLKKLTICFERETYNLHEVLYKLQTLTELTSLSLMGEVKWKFGEKVPFLFKKLTSFSLEFTDIYAIELDHLMLGMPKLQRLHFPTWNNNEFLLHQPAINIRYLYLPDSVYESDKTNWINFLKNLPNLVQVKNCSKYDSIVDEITAGDLAYYLKVLREYFKSELLVKIQYDCLPVLLLKKDAQLLKLVRSKSKQLVFYLNEIFPLSTFGTFANQLFMIEFEVFFSSINFPFIVKFFKLLSELEVGDQPEAMFVKGILLDEWHERLNETIDFSLSNFYDRILNYIIRRDKISLNMEHIEFVIQFSKANKRYGLSTIVEFAKVFFISISTVNGNNKFVDGEMFIFFSSYLLMPSFRSFFDKILNKELSEKEKKFLPLDYESIGDDLKKLEPEQYEELSVRFKDLLFEFVHVSFIEEFSNLLRKILIPATKCAICYESLFSEECSFFFSSEKKECHLFHKSCLYKWLNANNKCPNCRQIMR